MTAAEPIGGGTTKTPVHLWIVGILSLLWNLMGVFDYLASQLELDFYLSQFTPEQLEYFNAIPAWAVAAWAFGVWGAFAGSIGLLLRRAWALWAFAVSIFGLLFSSIYSFVLSRGVEVMGSGAMVFNGIIWVVAIFLLVYAVAMKKRGVLT